MAQTNLQVWIGDPAVLVGRLTFESTGNREHSVFKYADSWLEHPRRFSLEPGLPLDDQRRFFKAEVPRSSPLPRAIADTLPDSWGRSIIRKDARLNRDRTGLLAEIDYLAAVDDFSRMGALRFRLDAEESPFLADAPSGRHVVPPLLQLDQLGHQIASVERDEPDMVALRRLRQIGTVFGGARPKCSVMDTDGTLALAKFTSQTDTMAVERAEVMTLNLARKCGLDAAHGRIEMSAGLPVAIIKRFDRVKGGRRPYISAQTMLESPLADGATYAQLADAIRENCMEPTKMLKELFLRVGFTILVSNVDDHLKNHGFLYAGNNQWALSPLFDVNPAPERFRELKTAIADAGAPEASIELLLDSALYFDLSTDAAAEAVKAMAQTINAEWKGFANEAGMTRAERDAFQDAFVHDEAAYALALSRTIASPGRAIKKVSSEPGPSTGKSAQHLGRPSETARASVNKHLAIVEEGIAALNEVVNDSESDLLAITDAIDQAEALERSLADASCLAAELGTGQAKVERVGAALNDALSDLAFRAREGGIHIDNPDSDQVRLFIDRYS